MSQENPEMEYDIKTNRIIITDSTGNKILVTPDAIRDILPTKNEKEKIDDLKMIFHYIEMEKLTKMNEYIVTIKKLDDGIVQAMKKLETAETLVHVKKWQAMVKSFVDRKNALAEIRRAVGLLEKDKKSIRIRIAKLETEGV